MAGTPLSSTRVSAARTPPAGCTLRTSASAASRPRSRRGVVGGADALVGGDGDADPPTEPGEVVEGGDRLLDDLEVEAGQAGDRQRRGVEVPGAVGVDPQRDVGADPRGRGDQLDVAWPADLDLDRRVAGELRPGRPGRR